MHQAPIPFRLEDLLRQVFRCRIYELGTRVTVLSPTEIRAEIVAELRSFLGASA